MSRQLLLAAVSAATLASCDGAIKPSEATTPSGQTWMCGREYVNHAWGYQRRGVLLDTAGTVWRYEFKGSPTALVNPWSPKDMSRLSEDELKLRYNGAVTTGKKVPADEITQHLPVIEEASNATPTQPKSVGADMGQNTLYCYTYDTAARTYAQVMLDNKGDWESTNPSSAAKTLTIWLDATLGEVK